ncbi:MAG: hypothetical protein R2939_15320 [Kofleriaceae bacterium]
MEVRRRWSCVVALGAAACGRLGFAPGADDEPQPGPTDAAAASGDAAAVAPDAWQCQPDPGWPVARSGRAVAYDAARDELVIHGGADEALLGVAETFTWSWTSGWTLQTPSTAGPAAHASTMTYRAADQRVVLMGGCLDGDCQPRVGTPWLWDGATWQDAGGPADGNYASSVAYDPVADVVTWRGGWDGSSNGHTRDWRDGWLSDVQGAKFIDNQIAYDAVGARMLFFGGYVDSVLQGATRVRATGGSWAVIAPPTEPSARAGVGATSDLARRQIVMFGGTDGAVALDETWIWDGTTWTMQAATPRPSARVHPHLAYDPNREVVLLFGGDDGVGAPLDDLWQWDGMRWTLLGPC